MNIRARVGIIKEKASEAGSTSPELRELSSGLLHFSAGLTLAAAKLLGSGAPFGVAAVAAAGGGVNGVCTLAGTCLGYILCLGLEDGVRFIAAAVIAFTLSFAFAESRIIKNRLFAPFNALSVLLLTGLLGVFIGLSELSDTMPLLFLESALGMGGCVFFREAVSDTECETEIAELRRKSAVLISVSCILMSLSGIVVFGGVSLGRVIAQLLLMLVSFSAGLSFGCTVGTVFGLGMDLVSGGVPFFTLSYAFSGLLSGVFDRHGRLMFTLSFVLATAVAAASVWGFAQQYFALVETFCASVIFMLLPTALTVKVGAIMKPAECGKGESGLRRYVSRRVMNLSRAYSGMYEVVRRNVETEHNDADPAKLFDRAADSVCVGCRDKNRCWNRDYMDTLSAMNDAIAAINKSGRLRLGDIPAHFAEKCRSPEAFVAAVNAELRAVSYRRQFAEVLRESRSTAWGQYRDFAEMLESISAELQSTDGADRLAERRLIRYLRSLDIDADTAVFRDSGGRLRAVIESGSLAPLYRDDNYLEKLSQVLGLRLCKPHVSENAGKLTLLEAEPLAVSVGIAAMKKKGEKVSGDRGTYFKTDSGVLCVILSDGMGCGEAAANDSREVIEILERFLRSGAEPAVAMKLLNSVMLLKTEENWGFATADLMCVDLFTGETSFYKYGAAPSYVMSGKSISRIKCRSFAPGLGTDGEPDTVKMRLKPGSTAIIASDGVLGDDNDEWLREILDSATDDMKLLARDTLRGAERIYGDCDDMTVLAVRVEERV